MSATMATRNSRAKPSGGLQLWRRVLDPETVCATISSSTDDAEEETIGGAMDLNSSDLELCTDRGTSQWVGMRFNNLNIPQGANIVNAYIQFETDETGNDDPATSPSTV